MFCCDMMKRNIFDGEEPHPKGSKTIFYSKRFNEYMISLSDDNASGICLIYCPWCGRKLPESKRERWFEKLEQMGVEFSLFDTDRVPLPYLSDVWWKDRESDCQQADDP